MKQVGVFEWAVATCGAMLIGLLWAPWYIGGIEGAYFNNSVDHPAYAGTYATWGAGNGIDTGTATSIVIVIVGALCIAQFIALWSSRSPAVGVAWNTGICWAAVILVVWMLVRVIWPPGGAFRDWGVWTTLIVALGLLNFAWLGMRDERTSRPRNREVPVRPIPPAA